MLEKQSGERIVSSVRGFEGTGEGKTLTCAGGVRVCDGGDVPCDGVDRKLEAHNNRGTKERKVSEEKYSYHLRVVVRTTLVSYTLPGPPGGEFAPTKLGWRGSA